MKNISWICSFVLIIVGLALAPWFVRAAPPALLPPPPVTTQPTATPLPPITPTATPAPLSPTAQPVPRAGSSSRAAGAWIELHLVFPEDWPWECQGARELFTALEQQDAQGAWHPVAGWQGELDAIDVPAVITVDTPVVGTKGWWVPQQGLGQGPFRWLVSIGSQGPLLAHSAPFYLPGQTGQRLSVRVTLPSLRAVVSMGCTTPTGKKTASEIEHP